MSHSVAAALRLVAVLAAITMLAGCASGPRIVTNSAPDFSLINFKTFGFLQPLSTDRGNVRTLTSSTLIDAATNERLWRTASKQLRSNLGGGPRTTVPGGLAVYGRERQPCRRCGTTIEMEHHGEQARSTYWCPQCQPVE